MAVLGEADYEAWQVVELVAPLLADGDGAVQEQPDVLPLEGVPADHHHRARHVLCASRCCSCLLFLRQLLSVHRSGAPPELGERLKAAFVLLHLPGVPALEGVPCLTLVVEAADSGGERDRPFGPIRDALHPPNVDVERRFLVVAFEPPVVAHEVVGVASPVVVHSSMAEVVVPSWLVDGERVLDSVVLEERIISGFQAFFGGQGDELVPQGDGGARGERVLAPATRHRPSDRDLALRHLHQAIRLRLDELQRAQVHREEVAGGVWAGGGLHGVDVDPLSTGVLAVVSHHGHTARDHGQQVTDQSQHVALISLFFPLALISLFLFSFH